MAESVRNRIIEHAGVVQKSDNKSVTVKILSASACSDCHAEGFCSLSGSEEKIIEVRGSYNVAPGDNVTILMSQSTGLKAVLLSYIVPLVLMITVLVIMLTSSASELMAGFVSIAALAPYYFVIWLLRKRISDKFTFTLKV